jgi:hypothetical protein
LEQSIDRIVEVGVLRFALNEVSEPGDDICLKESSFGKLGEAGLLELSESSSDVCDESFSYFY